MAGVTALVLVGTFWTASAAVELFGSSDAAVGVKTAIAWGLLILVPAIAATNVSGLRGARRRTGSGRQLPKLLVRKQQRGIAIAAIGMTVLVPCALWLAWRANAGLIDGWFHVVQGIELVAGAINLALLSLNARDGYRMRAPSPRTHAHGVAAAVEP